MHKYKNLTCVSEGRTAKKVNYTNISRLLLLISTSDSWLLPACGRNLQFPSHPLPPSPHLLLPHLHFFILFLILLIFPYLNFFLLFLICSSSYLNSLLHCFLLIFPVPFPPRFSSYHPHPNSRSLLNYLLNALLDAKLLLENTCKIHCI